MTSSVKKATRPSKVIIQSISAKELQLWTGSGLFTNDTSMNDRTTFFSNGSICLTIKDSPKIPPGKSKKRGGVRTEDLSSVTKIWKNTKFN